MKEQLERQLQDLRKWKYPVNYLVLMNLAFFVYRLWLIDRSADITGDVLMGLISVGFPALLMVIFQVERSENVPKLKWQSTF